MRICWIFHPEFGKKVKDAYTRPNCNLIQDRELNKFVNQDHYKPITRKDQRKTTEIPTQDQIKTNARPLQDQRKTTTRPTQDHYKTINSIFTHFCQDQRKTNMTSTIDQRKTNENHCKTKARPTQDQCKTNARPLQDHQFHFHSFLPLFTTLSRNKEQEEQQQQINS